MNRAILIGRLVRDPEMRTTQSGNSVSNFTLAVDRRFKDKNGERQTNFIPCVAWGKTAEFIDRYFGHGVRVAVMGSIQPRSWQDDNGNKRYITEVIVEEAYFADGKREDGGKQYGADPYSAQQQGGYFYGGDDANLPFNL